MLRAGIAIDDWKLPIFQRHLSEAGFKYKQREGVTADALMLYVETDDMERLYRAVKSANAAAARSKLQ